MKLTVNLGANSYPIYIENDILSRSASCISEVFNGRRIMIISDDNVYPLYGELLTKQLSKDIPVITSSFPMGKQPRISRHFRPSTPLCWRLRSPEAT